MGILPNLVLYAFKYSLFHGFARTVHGVLSLRMSEVIFLFDFNIFKVKHKSYFDSTVEVY